MPGLTSKKMFNFLINSFRLPSLKLIPIGKAAFKL